MSGAAIISSVGASGLLDSFLRKVHSFPKLRWRMDLQRVIDEVRASNWKSLHPGIADSVNELQALLDRAWVRSCRIAAMFVVRCDILC